MDDVEERVDGVVKVTAEDVGLAWSRRLDQELILADALDEAAGGAMTVGFARYGAGESNPWTMSYDEVLVITEGRFVVEHAGGAVEAGPGEAIYQRSGTELVYRAAEATQLVYVTHPHWLPATEASPHAARLDEFRPASPGLAEPAGCAPTPKPTSAVSGPPALPHLRAAPDHAHSGVREERWV